MKAKWVRREPKYWIKSDAARQCVRHFVLKLTWNARSYMRFQDKRKQLEFCISHCWQHETCCTKWMRTWGKKTSFHWSPSSLWDLAKGNSLFHTLLRASSTAADPCPFQQMSLSQQSRCTEGGWGPTAPPAVQGTGTLLPGGQSLLTCGNAWASFHC